MDIITQNTSHELNMVKVRLTKVENRVKEIKTFFIKGIVLFDNI
jgi:hypothetical protein